MPISTHVAIEHDAHHLDPVEMPEHSDVPELSDEIAPASVARPAAAARPENVWASPSKHRRRGAGRPEPAITDDDSPRSCSRCAVR